MKFPPHRKFLVDIPHGWSEVISRQEHSDGDTLPSDRSTVHDLVPGHGTWVSIIVRGQCQWQYLLGNCLILVEGVRSTSSCLALDDCNFHMFNLDSHEEKVNFAHNDILQVVL